MSSLARKANMSGAVDVFNRAFRGVQYETRADGVVVRIWEDVDCCNAEHVVQWLGGKRAVDSLDEGLEFVKQATIDRLVRDKHLKKGAGGMYWITEKGADHYGLKKLLKGKYKWPQA